MTTLYLVRHGETIWNAEKRFQGHQDTSLNDTGRRQAALAARALRQAPLTAIYTSDLRRSRETAEIIAAPHGLTPIADARLREAYFGEWEGLTLEEITGRWPAVVAAWKADSLHTRPPGGESLEQLQHRVGELLTMLVRRYPDDALAIVGHGGSLKAVIAMTLGTGPAVFPHLRLDNCAVSQVIMTDTRSTLVRFNAVGHLDVRETRPPGNGGTGAPLTP